MTVALTLGTFDLLHWGHLQFLARVRALVPAGDVVVGVNSDRFVREFKGEPVQTQEDRRRTLELVGYHTVLNDGPGWETIDSILPDILAVGSDWQVRDYYAQIDCDPRFLEDANIKLVYVPYSYGVSTTTLRERIVDLHRRDPSAR